MDLVARRCGMQANADSGGARMPAVGFVVAVLLAASLPACDNECPIARTKCVGNELWTCPNDPDGPYHWAKRDCGAGICVTTEVPESPGRVESFCALEAEPRPACSWVVKTCDGAEMLACNDGFVVAAQKCGSEDLCATGVRNMSLCPLAPSPDPRCEAAEPGWRGSYVCAGAASIECHVDTGLEAEFAVSELDCGAAGCSHGVCGTDGSADPRCEAAAAAHPEWPVQVTCDANVALVCSGDHLLYQSTCGLLDCVPGGPPGEPGIGGYCG
jgi:hypothetical protein